MVSLITVVALGEIIVVFVVFLVTPRRFLTAFLRVFLAISCLSAELVA